MTELNRNTALKLAREKWGIMAFAKKRQYAGDPFGVGIRRDIIINAKTVKSDDYYGFGFTWEEAFEDAQKKGY